MKMWKEHLELPDLCEMVWYAWVWRLGLWEIWRNVKNGALHFYLHEDFSSKQSYLSGIHSESCPWYWRKSCLRNIGLDHGIRPHPHTAETWHRDEVQVRKYWCIGKTQACFDNVLRERKDRWGIRQCLCNQMDQVGTQIDSLRNIFPSLRRGLVLWSIVFSHNGMNLAYFGICKPVPWSRSRACPKHTRRRPRRRPCCGSRCSPFRRPRFWRKRKNPPCCRIAANLSNCEPRWRIRWRQRNLRSVRVRIPIGNCFFGIRNCPPCSGNSDLPRSREILRRTHPHRCKRPGRSGSQPDNRSWRPLALRTRTRSRRRCWGTLRRPNSRVIRRDIRRCHRKRWDLDCTENHADIFVFRGRADSIPETRLDLASWPPNRDILWWLDLSASWKCAWKGILIYNRDNSFGKCWCLRKKRWLPKQCCNRRLRPVQQPFPTCTFQLLSSQHSTVQLSRHRAPCLKRKKYYEHLQNDLK